MKSGLCIYILVILTLAVADHRFLKLVVEGLPEEYNSLTQPPAVYIFGDSTVDVGTNNHLKDCGTKADSPYYGIDFDFSKPTGRFSNGHNIADLIVRHLGYKRSPPPFLSLISRESSFKSAILRGANFASGGSGIFDQTGNKTYKEVVPLRKQIQQFATVCGNITEVLGKAKADELISKSMYIISVGSNDIFEYSANATVLPDIFMANLIEAYTIQLEELFNLGARKFGVLSVGAIGCVPIMRALDHNGNCVDKVNQLAQAFYAVVSSLLQQFSSQFQGFTYSLGNLYDVTMSTILNSVVEGLTDVRTPCCGDANTTCKIGVKLCANRNDYLFWDMYHPTQVASDRAARVLLFSEAAEFVKPINISRLAVMP
ncbi:GDSL esterase/lipase [Heracleum sosnowskyi]|uniref:GDSL esterase/lipase n=1 Tax=Heracleum sosnowskyi TaxID=360622 RepID=A0AAD8IL47_9APIA|nr:GDSL esterase/lipase [Heracleum sosnowskyi]